VLIALGMYPNPSLLGSEGAGVVLETGSAVTGLAPGDHVMGMITGGFGPTAVTDHRTVTRVPVGWTFTEAATTPIVFLTAWYAFRDLAALQAGERVLIHAGAGGVGMAAIQLARHIGAEVFATASPGKWDTLRGLGLDDDHIANSRDTGFARKFLDATGGEGVDVVLNSLAREFVDASLELLPRGGRFVEMGKTDIRDAAAMPDGIAYRAFDLAEAGPDRTAAMLAELVALFTAGALRTLPVRAWDVRDAREAFRHVSQARHIGKVVLTLPRTLDPDGTVLVTGATGTLGGLVAKHLVTDHGIRHLLLLSRTGSAAPGAAELTAELTALGATVTLTAADTADRGQLAAALGGIPAGHPLTGVFHAAGVLDDGVIGAQTPQRLDTVLRPKADAGALLHELTAGADLAAFVLFSSAASTFGAAGQGNYAAANAYLDGLAQHRAAHGLPGLSLAWGLWEQASTMTGHLDGNDLSRVSRGGTLRLATDEGLALLDTALTRPEALLVPVGLDLAALREQAAAGALSPLLRGLVRGPARRTAAAAAAHDTAGLAVRLAGLAPADRDRALLDLVCGQVAVVLGHESAGTVNPDRAFKELGFDSLTAVELRNRLGAATGLRLPATLIFDHPNPRALADLLRAELGLDRDPAAPAAPALAELDALEAALAGLTPGGTETAAVTARLETLLSKWRDAQGASMSPTADAREIDSATDDDLFDLIDEEFGLS
jgi:NADPH:quinone reductase-like Zn-dependent oxidoreductase/acyl carrier protein